MTNEVRTIFTADGSQLFKVADLADERIKSFKTQINGAGQNPTFGGRGLDLDVKSAKELSSLQIKIAQQERAAELTKRAVLATERERLKVEESRISLQSRVNRTETAKTKSVKPVIDKDLAKANEIISGYEKNRVLINKSSLAAIEQGEKSLTRIKIAEGKAQNDAAIREIKQRQQAAQQAQQAQLKADSNSGGGGLFGQIVGGNLVARAITEVSSAALSGGKSLLDYSASLEQAQIGFSTLTGSASAAQRHISDLQQFAKSTPFEFAGLAKNSQLLQGVGIQAQRVIPILNDVGNALSAAGKSQESVDRTILALSQIVSKGTVRGQEINQLAENGISAVTILSQALGKTKAEVLALSEAGQISSETFLKALNIYVKQNNIGDAMEKQSKTFNGALSNIKDSLYITGSTAFKPLFNKISTLSSDIAGEVSKDNKGLQSVGTTIANSIAKGFGQIISDSIKNEINNARKNTGDGKGGGLFALTNANYNIGSSLYEGIIGKSYPDLVAASYRLSRQEKVDNGFNVGDLQDLKDINFFGTFDKDIAKLEEEKQKIVDKIIEAITFKGDDFSPLRKAEPLDIGENSIQTRIDAMLKPGSDGVSKAKVVLADLNKLEVDFENAVSKFSTGKKLGFLGAIGLGAFSNSLDVTKAADKAKNDLDTLRRKFLSERADAAEKRFSRNPTLEDARFNLTALNSIQKSLPEEQFENFSDKLKDFIKNDLEKANEKIKEIGKNANSVFETFYEKANKDNPFANILSEADKASKELQKTLGILDPALQSIANTLQQKLNADSLFNTRLENDFAAFDLRSSAADFRKPQTKTIEDADKFFSDFIEAGLKQISKNNNGGIRYNSNIFQNGVDADGKPKFFTNGFSQSTENPYTRYNSNIFQNGVDANGKPKMFTNGFSQSDARNDLLYTYERTGGFQASSNGKGFGNNLGGIFRRERTFDDLTEKEKNDFINKDNLSLQDKISRSIDLATNRNALNDEQKRSVDRKIISLTQGIDPSKLTDNQRDAAASAREREAERIDQNEAKAREQREKQITLQTLIGNELVELRKLAQEKGLSGFEQTVRFINDSDTELDFLPKRPQ